MPFQTQDFKANPGLKLANAFSVPFGWIVMKLVTARTFTAFLFFIVLGSQASLHSQKLHPRISYRIHVNRADLSGFNVEMQIRGAGNAVRLAMAAHPEDDVELLLSHARKKPLAFSAFAATKASCMQRVQLSARS